MWTHINRRILGALFVLLSAVPASALTSANANSDSEATAHNGAVSIRYRVLGRSSGAPLLLISGTGNQLIDWSSVLLKRLTEKGFRVVIFDNRDSGLSTNFDLAGPPDWAKIISAMKAGSTPPVVYTAKDMADDAVAVLNALHIQRANIVGISGGAIIAEIIAADNSDRTLSLTAIAANSGNPAFRIPAKPERFATLPPALPKGSSESAILDRQVNALSALQSLSYPRSPLELREMAKRSVRRAYHPEGVDRQGAAMLLAGDLRRRLQSITVPTIIVHGMEDPLLPWELGRDVATSIPKARFVLIKGMGHDLPDQVIPTIVQAIVSVARR